MNKLLLPALILGCFGTGLATAATPLTSSQMDSVTAGVAPSPTGFVCPVISTENVLHAKNGGALGIEGYYTVGGPMVGVPIHATNDDGAGRPQGPFAMPGDTTYTAIWSTAP